MFVCLFTLIKHVKVLRVIFLKEYLSKCPTGPFTTDEAVCVGVCLWPQ